MTGIRLCVVIPVYDNWDDATECLAALSAQSTSAFDILIADDGSPTKPPTRIQSFSRARYLRNTHRGFGGNCNAAADEAIRSGATHILFLNDDTTFSTRFIECWLQSISSNPNRILSPVIYWFSKPTKVWYSGGNLSIWVPFLKLRHEYVSLTEVDMVSGCAMLVPASHWRELGGFDESYETYFEDLDLTLRAKARGIRTFVVPHPDLKVRHKVSGSFRKVGRWKQEYLYLTTRLIFIRRHFTSVRRQVCLVLSVLHIVVVTLLCLPDLPSPKELRAAVSKGLTR